MHPAVAPDAPVRQGYAGLTLRTADLEKCAAALKEGGIEFERDRGAAIHVPPDQAGGVALAFSKA
jgi:hypothetical protein